MDFFRKKIKKSLLLLIVGDIILIISTLFLSLLFRFDFKIPSETYNLLNNANLFLIVIIKFIFFKIFGLYRGMWRFTSVWDLFNIIKANFMSTLVLITAVYYSFGFDLISRSVFVIDFMMCVLLISTSRLGIRIFFSQILIFFIGKKISKKKKKVLLIGAGHTGQSILRQLILKSSKSIQVIGFIDDDLKKVGRELNGYPVLGTIKDLSKYTHLFDLLYICVPSANRYQMRLIVEECKKVGKPFKTLPSLSELIEKKISVSQLREVSLSDLLGRKEITLDKKLISKFITGKRVLVTGAGGSIGSELVRQCIQFTPSILIMIDISEFNLFQVEREFNSSNSEILFKPILSDIRDYNLMESVFEEFKPQIVFHAAAYKHVPMQEKFPWEAIKTNVHGSLNISEISVKHKVEKFVLVSTDKAVKPTSVMGATKRLAEIIMQHYNIKSDETNFISVRFGNVLGSSGSVIPIFQEQIKNGGPITITDPEMTRYFMSIPEASQLILQAGSLGEGGAVYILDMGNPIKIVDIANELIRLSGFEPGSDILLEITGVRPGEKKIEELSLPTEHLDETKHEKIFVVNDKEQNEINISDMISNIDRLKNQIHGKTAIEVRSMIAKVLTEYEPDIELNSSSGFLKIKAEA